jgi:hypothetical protein
MLAAGLTPAVRDRLTEAVPALSGRVILVADFAALQARNQLPQVTPAAVVLPVGMRGGALTAVMGAFRQVVARRVGIILIARVPEQAKARGTDDIELLAEAVLDAVLGWTPDPSTPGVLRLEAGNLRSPAPGTLLYDITFVLDDQFETA